MKIRRLLYILIGILSFTTLSCEDSNNWPIEEGHERLFRSTKFEVIEVKPTYAILSYRGVNNATKYIFEFSEGDSLLFDNIVNTIEILTDTLTPYNKENTAVKTEYRTIFKDLNGTTRYSVRMRAIDENQDLESGYVELFFDTTDEQLFTNATPGTTSVTLQWIENESVTHIEYAELVQTVSGEEDENVKTDTIWAKPHELSPTEKENGELVINDLKLGTNYLAYIFKDKVRRGSYRFKTLGSSSGENIQVMPEDDINTLLTEVSSPDVTLSFNNNYIYEINELKIPANIKNLYLSGNVINNKTPKLKISKFVFSSPMENLYLQYIDIESDGNSQFLIEINNENCFENITFEGCYISEIPRSLIRANTDKTSIERININNCFIKNVGLSGYGLLNIGKLKSLGSIIIEKSTLFNIGDQVMDVRLQVDEIRFTQSTFCNYTVNMPKVLRLDKQPKNITVTGVIFTGNNAGGKINSGNGDYTNYLSFAGCYLTSDLIENTRKFNDAKILEISSEELFMDSYNGDFHFNPQVRFEGDGKVGDPRWWTD